MKTVAISETQPAPGGLATVAAIRTIELPRYVRADGEVVVAEAFSHVPFAIARLFTLTAPRGARRGEHAHRRCSQFMLCLHGGVEVICDDGRDRKTFTLDRNHLALCVPPGIWNAIVFPHDRAVLAVLCDRPYEETDYLRQYPDFLSFRKAST